MSLYISEEEQMSIHLDYEYAQYLKNQQQLLSNNKQHEKGKCEKKKKGS